VFGKNCTPPLFTFGLVIALAVPLKAYKQQLCALCQGLQTAAMCPLSRPANSSYVPSVKAYKQQLCALCQGLQAAAMCPLSRPTSSNYVPSLVVVVQGNSVKVHTSSSGTKTGLGVNQAIVVNLSTGLLTGVRTINLFCDVI